MTTRSTYGHIVRAGRGVARYQAGVARQNAARQRERQREARRQAVAERRDYVASRAAEAEALNADLEEQGHELKTLLVVGLRDATPLDFDSLKHERDCTPFAPGTLAVPEPAPASDRYAPPALRGLHRLLPWSRRAHADATERALRRF